MGSSLALRHVEHAVGVEGDDGVAVGGGGDPDRTDAAELAHVAPGLVVAVDERADQVEVVVPVDRGDGVSAHVAGGPLDHSKHGISPRRPRGRAGRTLSFGGKRCFPQMHAWLSRRRRDRDRRRVRPVLGRVLRRPDRDLPPPARRGPRVLQRALRLLRPVALRRRGRGPPRLARHVERARGRPVVADQGPRPHPQPRDDHHDGPARARPVPGPRQPGVHPAGGHRARADGPRGHPQLPDTARGPRRVRRRGRPVGAVPGRDHLADARRARGRAAADPRVARREPPPRPGRGRPDAPGSGRHAPHGRLLPRPHGREAPPTPRTTCSPG